MTLAPGSPRYIYLEGRRGGGARISLECYYLMVRQASQHNRRSVDNKPQAFPRASPGGPKRSLPKQTVPLNELGKPSSFIKRFTRPQHYTNHPRYSPETLPPTSHQSPPIFTRDPATNTHTNHPCYSPETNITQSPPLFTRDPATNITPITHQITPPITPVIHQRPTSHQSITPVITPCYSPETLPPTSHQSPPLFTRDQHHTNHPHATNITPITPDIHQRPCHQHHTNHPRYSPETNITPIIPVIHQRPCHQHHTNHPRYSPETLPPTSPPLFTRDQHHTNHPRYSPETLPPTSHQSPPLFTRCNILRICLVSVCIFICS